MSWSSDATLGSGLWDRAIITVNSVSVKYPYEKAPQTSAVVFEVERNIDGDVEDDHLWLKPGNFEPGDSEGSFLVHSEQTPDVYDTPGAKKKKINNRSVYGKFLASFAEAVGFDTLEKAQDPARSKYEIWDVKFWEGMVLDVEMVEEKFTVDDDDKPGEKKEVTSRYPVVRGLVSLPDGSAPAASAATPPPVAGGATNGSITEDQAKLLAKTAGTRMKYLEELQEAGGDPSGPLGTKEFFEAAIK